LEKVRLSFMSTTEKTTTRHLNPLFGLILGIVLGAFVRLAPVLGLDFPLNDGGFFFAMIRDLQHSSYRLPSYASYNLSEIPYAYPPFGFYLSGALSDFFNLPLLDVIRLLPPLMSVLTIPAFYLLCRRLLASHVQTIVATIAFALMPTAFDWLVVGGGLTRAPGNIFAILTLAEAVLLFKDPKPRHLTTTALFGSLTVLSHPGTAWFTVYSVLVLYIFTANDRKKGALNSLLIAVGVLILTAPWWATIIARHGLATLLYPFQTEGLSLLSLLIPFSFMHTNEPMLNLLGMSGLLGLFACLKERNYLLPTWLGAVFLFEPRLIPTYSTLPMALLAGAGLLKVILPGIRRIDGDPWVPASTLRDLLTGWPVKVFAGYVLLYALIAAFLAPNYHSLSPDQRQAMEWVKANTASTSQFAVVSDIPEYGIDYLSEWFPALTGRACTTIPQGHEWLPGQVFNRRVESHAALQACADQDTTCLEDWMWEFNTVPTHIFLAKSSQGEIRTFPPLDFWLDQSPHYWLEYDGPTARVYTLEAAP
jgi:hypothetical protein